jgi:hypothetical protein
LGSETSARAIQKKRTIAAVLDRSLVSPSSSLVAVDESFLEAMGY